MLLSVTSRTGSAVEGTLGVVAGDSRVGGARFVGEVTLINVSHTGRVPGWSLPATLTNALIFRLFIGKTNSCHSKSHLQQNTMMETQQHEIILNR